MIELPHYLDLTTEYSNEHKWYRCTIKARYPYNFTYHNEKMTVLYIALTEDELIHKLQQLITIIELETNI